jgi:predicted ATP-dependent endonuclease of OLD family
MIEKISLTNFRKFEKFSVALHKGNILVGPNNCGKSSILDAFRLLDACYRHTRMRSPSLLNVPGEGIFDAYEIPERLLPFKLANATHNYSDADAIAEFWLKNKARAVIRLHPDHQTRFYIDKNQSRLTTSSKFRNAFPVDLVIVPTLAPLEVEEPLVSTDTVQRNERTRLASRVLRNIWLSRSDEEFSSFRDDVESAWPKIQLHKPHRVLSQPPVC